jgi:acyl-CoA thioesterase I
MKRFSLYGALALLILGVALFFAPREKDPALPPAPTAVAPAPAPVQTSGKLVLAFGDSLTAGYGLEAAQSFPAQLEAALKAAGNEARVHNAGVSGDTTSAGKARLGWVIDSLAKKPDLAILELGGNDMLRGLSPAQTRANLETMIAEFKRRNIPLILAGMRASPNMGQAYQAEFDGLYPVLAEKHGLTLYPFFMEGVVPNRALLIADQIHPNPQGVAVMVKGMLPLVQAGLNKTS